MEKHYNIASGIADLLDNKFKIFGFRFGLDPVIGTVPILGDIISVVLSLYIIWIGMQMGIPRNKIAQMAGNVVMDFVLGAVPAIGDIADFFFKSNLKNMEILRAHCEQQQAVVEGEIVE